MGAAYRRVALRPGLPADQSRLAGGAGQGLDRRAPGARRRRRPRPAHGRVPQAAQGAGPALTPGTRFSVEARSRRLRHLVGQVLGARWRWVTLAVLAGCVVLGRLGLWQLQRLEAHRAALPPL